MMNVMFGLSGELKFVSPETKKEREARKAKERSDNRKKVIDEILKDLE